MLCFSGRQTYLGVAPLSYALPAEQVSTGCAGGVPPGLQAEDAAGGRRGGALRAIRTANKEIASLMKTASKIKQSVSNIDLTRGDRPEASEELPLLPGSLSLPEAAHLQSHAAEQLQERNSSQQPVGCPD